MKATVRHKIIKLQTSDKEENLKNSQRKKAHYTQRNKYKSDTKLLIRKYVRRNRSMSLEYEKKNLN